VFLVGKPAGGSACREIAVAVQCQRTDGPQLFILPRRMVQRRVVLFLRFEKRVPTPLIEEVLGLYDVQSLPRREHLRTPANEKHVSGMLHHRAGGADWVPDGRHRGHRTGVQGGPVHYGRVVLVLAFGSEHGAFCRIEQWRILEDADRSLWIATIDGGPSQQTWVNLARALEAASQVVTEDGAIAICSDLAAPPGPAIRCLAEADSAEDALRTLNRQRAFDAIPAAWLLHVLQDHTVFLLSRLDENTVDDLGMAYMADAEDLVRLCHRFNGCITLRGAQHLAPTVTDTAPDDL